MTQVDACILAILEELPAFARALTDDDLKTARELAEGALLRERERPEDLLRDLARAWASGDASESLEIVPRLASVERGDFGRLFDRFVIGRPFVLSVHLSQSRIDRGLDARHFQTLIDGRQPARPGR